MAGTRSCYEFTKRYDKQQVNCRTCKHKDECEDRREREFDRYDKEMKSNKGVFIP